MARPDPENEIEEFNTSLTNHADNFNDRLNPIKDAIVYIYDAFAKEGDDF